MIELAVLYTLDCPRCKILEQKLEQSGMSFTVCKDKELMLKNGFDLLPILEVDGKRMGFKEAVKWINERKESV